MSNGTQAILTAILADVNAIMPNFVSLVNSYRLLVGGAEEISRTRGVSPDVLARAIERYDRTGMLIDIIIDLLCCKISFSSAFLEVTCAPVDLVSLLANPNDVTQTPFRTAEEILLLEIIRRVAQNLCDRNGPPPCTPPGPPPFTFETSFYQPPPPPPPPFPQEAFPPVVPPPPPPPPVAPAPAPGAPTGTPLPRNESSVVDHLAPDAGVPAVEKSIVDHPATDAAAGMTSVENTPESDAQYIRPSSLRPRKLKK